MKRHQRSSELPVEGLKPYVPKRTKLASGGNGKGEAATGPAAPARSPSGSKIFTVNPTLACHVGGDTGRGLPRCRNREYSDHTNVVGSLQWNIPRYGHLLLSSSLDQTVKIWDCFSQKRCVRTLDCHKAGVKTALWTADGTDVLSGGFDRSVMLTDAQYNKTYQQFDHSSFITCLRLCPSDPQVFLAGTDNNAIFCWDMRIGQAIHEYKGKLGRVLSMEFLPGKDEFLVSCDFVCRNSDDRNIMVFDMRTTAVISNQIYHEKYTCPHLRVHPEGSSFVAQSNGNYAALFSTKSPYRLNKCKRFEGHQIEGYPITCEFSSDGTVLGTGSSDGKLYFYDFVSSNVIKTLPAYDSACLSVQFHPVLGNMVASCSWKGQVTVWH